MTNIFVAKLDFGVSDETLRELFESYGTVLKCQIAKDRETGKPRGFAFIEMKSPEETQAAIRALDGYTISGRSMVVKLAEDRSNSRGSSPRPSGQDKPYSRPSSTTNDSGGKRPDSDFRIPVSSSDDSDSDSSTSFVEKTPKRAKDKKKKPSDKSDSREFKMSAYKKSGKKNRVEFDDDDDWELEFRKNQKKGWSDEDEDL